ncbi:hypothetical protein VZG28_04895 [Synechococcus elongatus IITB4]|uniref:hypothetical protein n=1 Tax=Synechococcus elongatus TaxID=32046 RepID=UPI0030D5E1F5
MTISGKKRRTIPPQIQVSYEVNFENYLNSDETHFDSLEEADKYLKLENQASDYLQLIKDHIDTPHPLIKQFASHLADLPPVVKDALGITLINWATSEMDDAAEETEGRQGETDADH